MREMTLDDADFYFRHFNNEKTVDGCCFPGPRDLKAAREELELYCIRPFKENRGVRWGIMLKEGNDLIGTCGYARWFRTPVGQRSGTIWTRSIGDKAS